MGNLIPYVPRHSPQPNHHCRLATAISWTTHWGSTSPQFHRHATPHYHIHRQHRFMCMPKGIRAMEWLWDSILVSRTVCREFCGLHKSPSPGCTLPISSFPHIPFTSTWPRCSVLVNPFSYMYIWFIKVLKMTASILSQGNVVPDVEGTYQVVPRKPEQVGPNANSTRNVADSTATSIFDPSCFQMRMDLLSSSSRFLLIYSRVFGYCWRSVGHFLCSVAQRLSSWRSPYRLFKSSATLLA